MKGDLAYSAGLVRDHDSPRYYATLFAAEPARSELYALYGFAAEIARIPYQVTDPTLGEMRLEWWRTSLDQSLADPGAAQSPVLPPLVSALKRHRLPLEPFYRLIDARALDLYADLPANRTDLEGRLGETESALFQAAAVILGGDAAAADLSGHSGVAYGIARRLSHFSLDRGRGRSILPLDILSSRGLDSSAVYETGASPALLAAVADLAALGRDHLARARQLLAGQPRALAPAYLPLAIVEPLLGRTENQARNGAAPDTRLSNLETLARIGWSAARGYGRKGSS